METIMWLVFMCIKQLYSMQCTYKQFIRIFIGMLLNIHLFAFHDKSRTACVFMYFAFSIAQCLCESFVNVSVQVSV